MPTTRNIGSYTNALKIDSGGFGTVYSALSSSKTKIALKQLNDFGISEKDKLRFIREVKIASPLSHQNIVRILDFDIECPFPWFSMPLALGNLRLAIEKARDDERVAVSIFKQILNGVGYLHNKKIVHRDLKPENVLLFNLNLEEGAIRISDFGLGKRLDRESVVVTSAKDYMGSAAYAPPEQFENLATLTERADIFSLGKIFFELLTGLFPMHVNLKHPRTKGKWEYLIGKCLEHDPNDRYASVEDILKMIELNQKDANFEKIEDRIAAVIAILNKGFPIAVRISELSKLLTQKEEDAHFFVRSITSINKGILESILGRHFSDYKNIFAAFCRHIRTEMFGFNFCDTISDKAEEIYSATNDLKLKLEILSALMDLAKTHNRFHVGGVVGKIIGTASERGEIMGICDVLRRMPDQTQWCKEYITSSKLPKIISDTLKEVASRE